MRGVFHREAKDGQYGNRKEIFGVGKGERRSNVVPEGLKRRSAQPWNWPVFPWCQRLYFKADGVCIVQMFLLQFCHSEKVPKIDNGC